MYEEPDDPVVEAWKSWERDLPEALEEIMGSYEKEGGINLRERKNLPSRTEISELLDGLLSVLFPGYLGLQGISRSDAKYVVGDSIHSIYDLLENLIERCLKHECKLKERCRYDYCAARAHSLTAGLIKRIPEIRGYLKDDIEAAYDGDPAAKSLEEVILAYPAIIAISTYRLAHRFYVEEVPFLPRVMSERAHSLTGIDIHPGAEIGRRFFIDHGTGTVIGETAVIGDNVKLYQGVTLGALSFPKDERGRIIKGGKRHPTIEDNVIIYSGATILGGETVIGHDSVVGGNCWVVDSVPANTQVMMRAPNQDYRSTD